MKIIGQIGDAKLIEDTSESVTALRVSRGKFNEGDKHWGMRSNMNFMKKLMPKEEEK